MIAAIEDSDLFGGRLIDECGTHRVSQRAADARVGRRLTCRFSGQSTSAPNLTERAANFSKNLEKAASREIRRRGASCGRPVSWSLRNAAVSRKLYHKRPPRWALEMV